MSIFIYGKLDSHSFAEYSQSKFCYLNQRFSQRKFCYPNARFGTSLNFYYPKASFGVSLNVRNID
ncbi:MAG: hypothetical protein Q4F66_14350, partial [Clostridium sp.]|nr:hypothetical protein [Clostridium sp.]